MVSITTESLGYVSPQHVRKLECVCKSGYGGKFDIILNTLLLKNYYCLNLLNILLKNILNIYEQIRNEYGIYY